MRRLVLSFISGVAGCGDSVGSDGGMDVTVQPDAASEASDARSEGGDASVIPDEAGCLEAGTGTSFGCWDGQCKKETQFCYSIASAIGSCEPMPCACEPVPSCACLVQQLGAFCKDAGTPKCTGTAMGGLTVTCP